MKKKFILLSLLSLLGLLGSFLPLHAAEEKKPVVISLHPILSDIARQLAGDKIELIDFLKPNGNLHAFEPAAQDLRHLSKASLVLASGKNIEPYLHKLKKNLAPSTILLDVGNAIPDVEVSAENAEAACCDHNHNADSEHIHDENCDHSDEAIEKKDSTENEHIHDENCDHSDTSEKHADVHNHSTGSLTVDPHWWHSADNMIIATQTIAQSLEKLLPSDKKAIEEKATALEKEFRQLKIWAKRILRAIPEDKRILVTGHAAFSHLCKELNFTPIAVQGIARQDEGSSQYLAKTIKRLREAQVQAIFPEYSANPKALDELAKTTKIKLARPLVSDGLAPQAHDFTSMYKYNIQTIADAYSQSEQKPQPTSEK